MGLRINTNVPSIVAQHRLDQSRMAQEHTQDKLASGSRITRAMDDAAGLAISEQLRAVLRSTDRNIKEANNGVFLLHTADGALNYITNMIIRVKELATAASSDTNGDKERSYYDYEVQSLKNEINRIARVTKFNGRPLLTGEAGDMAIQVGPMNDDSTDRIYVTSSFEISTDSLGLDGINLLTADSSRGALEPLHDALDVIARIRGEIGAGEAALSSTVQNLQQYEESLSSAFSLIRDTDIAAETAELAKQSILTQAGVAVLSQSNQIPSIALKLLSPA